MVETVEKKYEPGKVEISSEEYRDLVEEAVNARHEASIYRNEKWQAQSERDKIKKELEEANKKIAELGGIINTLQQACGCNLRTNNKEDA